MSSILEKKSLEVICEGRDEDIKKAVENCFVDMRKKVSSEISDPIISLSTKDVYLLEKSIEKKEEAFLYVFSKRVREINYLKLKITLDISYIKI